MNAYNQILHIQIEFFIMNNKKIACIIGYVAHFQSVLLEID